MLKKVTLRWQFLLAVIGLSLVWAILSYQVKTIFVDTPYYSDDGCSAVARVPATGGAFVEGIVGAPQFLNPLLSDAFPVDREINNLLFDGLTQVDPSGEIIPALAQSWTVGENGRYLQFTLRDNIFWHDGQPVTANDVAFTYGLIQDDAFPGSAALKSLWQSVSITVIDTHTIEFLLAEPYAPFLAETTRGILPAHLLQDVTAVTLPTHPFNQSPIGTGPFLVNATQNWQQTGQLQLLPNPDYWQQETQLSSLEFRFFPDEQTVLDAFADGDIHAISYLSAEFLPQITAPAPLRGQAVSHARLLTVPHARYSVLLFNQSDNEDVILQNVTMRQALAFGLDRSALIDEVLNGQGLLLEGPYLPKSWAYNPANITIYASNPISATNLLEENGWLLSDGQTVRQQDEAPLTIRLVGLTQEQEMLTAVAAQWAAIGIDTQINSLPTIAELRQLLTSGDFDIALVDIIPSNDPDLYDFWSQEAIIHGQNFTKWNNRRASEALEAGRQLWELDQRRPFYDTFLRLYNTDLPALTLYQHTSTYTFSQEVNQIDVGLITQPRDKYNSFSDWFLEYQEISVPCSNDETS